MSYVYIHSEPNLYTVGFSDPKGGWHPDSDYASRDEAAKRVAFLNGNQCAPILTSPGFSEFWKKHPELKWDKAMQLYHKEKSGL